MDENKCTLLHKAAKNGDYERVKLLLYRYNFSPFLRNKWGETPADVASKYKHHEIARMFHIYIA